MQRASGGDVSEIRPQGSWYLISLIPFGLTRTYRDDAPRRLRWSKLLLLFEINM